MSRERNPRFKNPVPAPRGARWLTLASGDHVLVDAGVYPVVSSYAWSYAGGREGSRYGLDDYMHTKYLCQGGL